MQDSADIDHCGGFDTVAMMQRNFYVDSPAAEAYQPNNFTM